MNNKTATDSGGNYPLTRLRKKYLSKEDREEIKRLLNILLRFTTNKSIIIDSISKL